MDVTVRPYCQADVQKMRLIWNEIVREGTSFPQEEPLGEEQAEAFFARQSWCGVAQVGEEIAGLYILHPNNEGRCGHIANTSYAVEEKHRGKHIGKLLVQDSIKAAANLSFRILQFNAVVASNAGAIHLYKKLGFTQLGIIPGGFRMDDGTYEDIIPFYLEL